MNFRPRLLLFAVTFVLIAVHIRAQALDHDVPVAPVSALSNIIFKLDSTPVVYRLGQNSISIDTARGFIQNLSGDSLVLGLKEPLAPEWIISTYVGGKRLFRSWPMDTIRIGPNMTVPIEVFITPYPDGPDTQSACFTIHSLRDSSTLDQCIPLYLAAPNVQITLDSSSILYALGAAQKTDTVIGSIHNYATDSERFHFSSQFGTGQGKWNLYTLIAGHTISMDSTIILAIGPLETLPLTVLVSSAVPIPDTAHVCFYAVSVADSINYINCIFLYPETSSDVSLPHSSSAGLYPNPMTTSAAIRISSEQAGRKPSIKIFDILGHDVTTMFGISESNNYIQLDRHVAPPGLYHYELISSAPMELIGGTFIVQ